MNYSMNGNIVLAPTLCELRTKLNGEWDMEIEHPLDDYGRWQYIEKEAVISASTFLPQKQLFRIYRVQKTHTGIIANASPIFFDSAKEVFLLDTRPTLKNGQEALNEMMKGTKYKGVSNILDISTAFYIRKNLMEAIGSDEDNSFLNRWGGEAIYDNYTIYLNKRAGVDSKIQVLYGKNIVSVNEDIDMTEVATRIIPMAYNGHMLSGNEPWVDSPNINKYQTQYIKEFKFEDIKLAEDAQEDELSFNTLEELRAELKKRCKLLFDEGIDKPKVTIRIQMADLYNTEEYKEFKELERIGLGDTVHCKDTKLGIVTDARVTELVWDCIKNRVESLKIGDVEVDYFSNVTKGIHTLENITDQNGNVAGRSIQGVIDGNFARLHAARDVAKKSGEPAILFEDLVQGSPTYGAMAFGTTGFMIANKRTPDDREWQWETFGTAEGFYATYLIAGILSSRNWIENTQGFMLDLDHGTINSKNMKLDQNGVLRLYQAIIEGGSLVVKNGNVPIFSVNQNGFGIGNNANTLSYTSGNSYMSINNELRLNTGSMTGYRDGQIGIRLNNSELRFYNWKQAGLYSGAIGSVYYAADKRAGVSAYCTYGQRLSLSITDSGGDLKDVIMIDSTKPNEPPYIRNTVSGTINPNNITKLVIKNGFVVDWS